MATQADKTNTGVMATIVVVGALSMIAISALLAGMVRSETSALDARSPTHADLETVARLDDEQTASLSAAPHWEDQATGKVGIPIRQAMRLVLDEYRKDPTAASPPPPAGMVMAVSTPGEGAANEAAGAAPAEGGASAPADGAAPTDAPAAASESSPEASPPSAAKSAVPSPAVPTPSPSESAATPKVEQP